MADSRGENGLAERTGEARQETFDGVIVFGVGSLCQGLGLGWESVWPVRVGGDGGRRSWLRSTRSGSEASSPEKKATGAKQQDTQTEANDELCGGQCAVGEGAPARRTLLVPRWPKSYRDNSVNSRSVPWTLGHGGQWLISPYLLLLDSGFTVRRAAERSTDVWVLCLCHFDHGMCK